MDVGFGVIGGIFCLCSDCAFCGVHDARLETERKTEEAISAGISGEMAARANSRRLRRGGRQAARDRGIESTVCRARAENSHARDGGGMCDFVCL